MFRRSFPLGLILTFLTLFIFVTVTNAGLVGGDLKVLPPISRGNLTIFPVVGGEANDQAHLLTLDEGLRVGTVTVTETGNVRGLVRGHSRPQPSGSGEVNRLVLVNDSDRPLLLLAGEIVTGGKQDRVIGADRIIPAHSGPIDLSVFCVEPGRWVASSDHFDTDKSVAMAQPSVRNSAMNDRDQQKVWDNVNKSRAQVSETIEVNAAAAAPVATSGVGPGSGGGVGGGVLRSIDGTTSYAKTMAIPEVQEEFKKYAVDYDSALAELKKTGARGVVVAINGRIIWADVFANNDLLVKYWQKLVRSYAAEAYTAHAKAIPADLASAQSFVDQLSGNHEVVETEPGVYRRSEITGAGFKVFRLTSLLPKSEETVHIAKMAYTGAPVAAMGQIIR